MACVWHSTQAGISTSKSSDKLLLCCILNSFVFDYVLRNKISGVNLNFFIVKQLPVLSPETFQAATPWNTQSNETLAEWFFARGLELSYTAWDLEPFARECNHHHPPFLWDENRRFTLRCELDAALFHLYGVVRDETEHILDTFSIVRRKDEDEFGSYRTKESILAIYDELQDAIDSKRPYQTRLDPPPADPLCCHPPNRKS